MEWPNEPTEHAPCSSCVAQTMHSVLFRTGRSDFYWSHDYAVLSCAGCGTISMRHSQINTSIRDDQGRPVLLSPALVRYYPSPVSRQQPKWLMSLKGELISLLREIYQAVDGGQHRLAAMGVRALLERVMIENIGDAGGFEKKLDAFEAAGFISSVQRETMRATLDVGDAAMHRAYHPEQSELSTCLDIAEGVMSEIYSHPDAAKTLAKRIPPRKDGREPVAKQKKS